MREPAWAPDGKHLAVVFFERIYTVLPDGREPRELTRAAGIQREPAWSADGRRLAFAADSGDGFDLFMIPTRGGSPQRITSLPGDERSPSWAPDGRIVFSHRAAGARQWDLYLVDPDANDRRDPVALTQTQDDEMYPRVSPDGRRVVFTSNRDNEDGDFDLWIMRGPRSRRRYVRRSLDVARGRARRLRSGWALRLSSGQAGGPRRG
jgi:Tol biopolymer transport system component